jgi:hypothetical protein
LHVARRHIHTSDPTGVTGGHWYNRSLKLKRQAGEELHGSARPLRTEPEKMRHIGLELTSEGLAETRGTRDERRPFVLVAGEFLAAVH